MLTSAQLVSRAVTVEVVTLAVLATVSLLGIVSLLAFACATHTVSVVAANVGAVVFAAGAVHVLRSHLVAAAFTLSAHTAFVTPYTEGGKDEMTGCHSGFWKPLQALLCHTT